MNQNYTIKKLFSELFPKRADVIANIETHMKCNGYDVGHPVILGTGSWTNNPVVIDGHTRLFVADELGVKPSFITKEFVTEDEAVDYAIHAQRDRRNLTDTELLSCIEKIDQRNERHSKKDESGKFKPKASNEAHGKSAIKTAQKLGISRAKVERARTINSGPEDIREKVENGELSISAAATQIRQRKAGESALEVNLPNQGVSINLEDPNEAALTFVQAIKDGKTSREFMEEMFEVYSENIPNDIIETITYEEARLQDICETAVETGIYCADCLDYMRDKMGDRMVDLTVTSPPYDNLRDYKGYQFNFRPIARELYRITQPGGVVVWVVGDATINGGETLTSFRQALYFQKIGFTVFDTMIYQKTGTSFPSSGRYTQIFEYMFVFSKGKPKTFNPIKDIPKLWEGSWGKTTRRNQDGTLESKSLKQGDGNRLKKRSNIWIIKNGKGFGTKDEIAYEHPAIFPEYLAEGHIRTWSNPGNLVFDPFCGSGTTCKMAKKTDRRFVGVDVSEQYCQIARKRLAEVQTQTTLFTTAA